MATLELKQNLKLTQQLTMTPQLKMAIKLLQLSRLELIEHLSQELEANPVLEEDTDMEGEEKTHELPIEEIDFKEGEGEEIVKNEVIDELKRIYDGIEKKPLDSVENEYREFSKVYSKYTSTLKGAIEKYDHDMELPEDFDSFNEELKEIKNKNDKNIYTKAVEAIKEKNYEQAYENLASLRKITLSVLGSKF